MTHSITCPNCKEVAWVEIDDHSPDGYLCCPECNYTVEGSVVTCEGQAVDKVLN